VTPPGSDVGGAGSVAAVTPTAPPSLRTIASRVEQRLDAVLSAEAERWRALDHTLQQPIDEIRRLVLSGGKRLRPAFCHWGFVGAGGADDDPLDVDAGGALELMHAFALFHDDVMDDAASRRGQPTTHTVAAQEHAREGWSGESRRFGEGVAILVGDLAFVLADRLMNRAPRAALALWDELRIELNIGQYLDIVGSVRGERDVARADRICRYKSGKYTIERPLHLGVALAAPDRLDELVPALSRYGLPLGDAFQMRDDVMGAFGDSTLTGKPVGDDLREGKPTPLLARAVRAADAGQRRVLDLVGRPDLTDADISAIQSTLVDTGALDELEAHIAALTGEALAALDDVDITEAAKDELRSLAAYVSWRQT
jgi:geranylgeranyl diphosphate synthase type I